MKFFDFKQTLLRSLINGLSLLTLFLWLAGINLAAPDDLDNTFGTSGKVITAFGNSTDVASSMVIQQDGKIIVAGNTVEGFNRFFAIVRYNSDGSLDTTFDNDGKVTTLIPFGNNNSARAVALQNDGKIVVAGTTENNANQGSFRRFAVVRYNTDGSLDTTFDTDGIAITQLTNGGDDVYDVAIQQDGKIIVLGQAYDKPALVRYDSNGSLDRSFGVDGVAFISIANGSIFGEALSIQTDGKIVLAGYIYRMGQNEDFAVVRCNSNGSIDSAFGNSGFVFTTITNGSDFASSLVTKPDGKIILGGTAASNSSFVFALVQYNPDGSLDTSFGSNGIVTTPGTWVINDLVIQPDGKIVAAGDRSFGPGRDVAIARYNSNGSLDTNFGTNGIVITVFPISDNVNRSATAYGVALQSDGKIVATGTTYNGSNLDIFVARYYDSCTYSLSPSTLNISASGGAGTLTVITQQGCAFTSESRHDFITINSGASGTGTSSVNFFVQANPGAARTGTIAVGSQMFTLNQSPSKSRKRVRIF